MPPNKEHINRSDEQLVWAALKGDTSSYGAIVERYWKMAVALAISKINNVRSIGAICTRACFAQG